MEGLAMREPLTLLTVVLIVTVPRPGVDVETTMPEQRIRYQTGRASTSG